MSNPTANPLPPAEMQALLDAALANKDRPNGMTDDKIRRVFALAGRHRNNPEFLKAWEEGVAEYRRQIQEEWEHDLGEGK